MLRCLDTVQRERAHHDFDLCVALAEKYLLRVSIYWSMNYNINSSLIMPCLVGEQRYTTPKTSFSDCTPTSTATHSFSPVKSVRQLQRRQQFAAFFNLDIVYDIKWFKLRHLEHSIPVKHLTLVLS